MTEVAEAAPAVQNVPINTEHAYAPADTRGTPPVERGIPEPEGQKATEVVEKRSIDDAIKAAIDKSKAKEEAKAAAEKPVEKPAEATPEKAAKPAERAPDGRFQPKAADPAKAVEQPAKPVETPKPTTYADAPSRFHESAKAEWATAPESVRAEATRAVQELEKGLEKYRASHERYEQIREYDEVAKSNGRDLKETLAIVKQFDDTLRSNPVGAIDMALRAAGMQKNDGSPVTFFDLAHHVLNQSPDQRSAQQNSTIASLQSEIQQLKGMVQQTQGYVEQQRIAPIVDAVTKYRDTVPDFDQYESAIQGIIESGIIPKSMPVADRLDRAYKMAVFNATGEFPAQGAHTAAVSPETPKGAHTAAPAPKTLNPSGQKSISGAPSAVAPTAKTARGPAPSIDESLQRALRKASV